MAERNGQIKANQELDHLIKYLQKILGNPDLDFLDLVIDRMEIKERQWRVIKREIAAFGEIHGIDNRSEVLACIRNRISELRKKLREQAPTKQTSEEILKTLVKRIGFRGDRPTTIEEIGLAFIGLSTLLEITLDLLEERGISRQEFWGAVEKFRQKQQKGEGST